MSKDKAAFQDFLHRRDHAMLGAFLPKGPVLQQLAEDASFALRHSNVLATNRRTVPGRSTRQVHVACDPEDLPFPPSSFHAVVGQNLLGRCPRPARALIEAERVLVAGGRLILIEPWIGPWGRVFWQKAMRHPCDVRLDPWFDACSDQNRAQGNAATATVCLGFRAKELTKWAASLQIERIEPFGGFSDLLALGRPHDAKRLQRLLAWEDRLPHWLRKIVGTRAVFVLEKAPFSA